MSSSLKKNSVTDDVLNQKFQKVLGETNCMIVETIDETKTENGAQD